VKIPVQPSNPFEALDNLPKVDKDAIRKRVAQVRQVLKVKKEREKNNEDDYDIKIYMERI
jgi:hypothetical protein